MFNISALNIFFSKIDPLDCNTVRLKKLSVEKEREERPSEDGEGGEEGEDKGARLSPLSPHTSHSPPSL
nr:hypothetical protein [Xenococcaceae cyanobacterium MO_188.B19]